MDITEQKPVDPNIVRQAAGFLKMEPLAHTDPNDNAKINQLVEDAATLFEVKGIEITEPTPVTQIALAVELWGRQLLLEDWLHRIMADGTMALEERIAEVFSNMAFMQAGPEAIDFPLYCIVKYQKDYLDTEYEPADIHCAADIALKIASDNNITDLRNTYGCVELVLLAGENFMESDEFSALHNIFKNDNDKPREKVNKGFDWLLSYLSV